MRNFDEMKNIASRCLHCFNPACVKKCPLENPIPKILEAISNDQWEFAKAILLRNSSSSLVCSKLCDFEKKCYGACVLNKTKDKGIPFYKVEEYLASLIRKEDFIYEGGLKKEKVAIIGAGISGITLAIDFARVGFETTLFEKNNRIGGVIVDSLPDFRFDDSVINKYIEILDNLKVKIEYNQTFGKNLQFEDLESFDILVFACGTTLSKSLFAKNQYVIDGIDLLRKVKRNQEHIEDKKVVVIGGGNVAIDIARVLVRDHNDVSIVYRRDLENAPASKKEIEAAMHDGVIFLPLLAPIQPIYENQRLIGLEVEKTKLIETSSDTRKRFILTGERLVVDTQIIVEAIGQNADYSIIQENYPSLFDENGWVIAPGIIVERKKIIALTGDYLTGASDFATASRTAKETFYKILEILQ